MYFQGNSCERDLTYLVGSFILVFAGFGISNFEIKEESKVKPFCGSESKGLRLFSSSFLLLVFWVSVSSFELFFFNPPYNLWFKSF